MKQTRIFLLPTIFFLLVGSAHAGKAEDLAAKVQKVYDKAVAYTADFEQETNSPLIRKPMVATGKLAFKKPGKVRFEYLKPIQQLMVSDGVKLWFYQPELQQVTITAPKQQIAEKLALIFLGGAGDIQKEFNVALGTTPSPTKGDVLKLTPKVDDATFNEILLVVDPKTGEVNETWIKTAVGQTLRYRFTNASTKRKLDDSEFTFQVPKGIDVIDEKNTPILKMR